MQATILGIVPGALSDYYDWAKGAKNGDTLVYWRGDLQYDRQIVIPVDDIMRGERRLEISVLNTVATRVLQDAKAGIVRLTQKKIGESLYEYRATRVRHSFDTAPTVQPHDDLVPA